jgi:hypothetical protein
MATQEAGMTDGSGIGSKQRVKWTKPFCGVQHLVIDTGRKTDCGVSQQKVATITVYKGGLVELWCYQTGQANLLTNSENQTTRHASVGEAVEYVDKLFGVKSEIR